MSKFPIRCQCLADVVCQIIDEMSLESRYLVEVDIPDEIAMPVSEDVLYRLLYRVIQHAAQSVPPGGELAFIGWESDEACELEIADNAGAVTQFYQQSLVDCQFVGARLNRSQCPQGGAALTVSFPKKYLQRSAA